ncbi:MAG: 3-isopropylmalate dehydratase large subunit [Thermoplasmata archaeon]|nr:MAG: 3-isopropylmalate dehydratase large subunit [Thermoplasmata archaeon]
MPMTIAQKTLALKSNNKSVEAGDIVVANADRAMSHDSTALVVKQFEKLGIDKVWDNERIIVVLDHRVPANTIESASSHKAIRDFVQKQEIKNFYDVGFGICHTLMTEQGHVKPGELILGTDSHTTTYGALGAVSTGIGATEMAALWATGQIWLKVPETIRIRYDGNKASNVFGKDIMLYTLGKLGVDFANYKAIEYAGNIIPELSIEDRITICNMSVEMGAKFGTFPFDDITNKHYSKRYPHLLEGIDFNSLQPDPDAKYSEERVFDLNELTPQIAVPNNVDNVKAVSEVAGKKFHQALLGTCTNSTLKDLEVAAAYLKGNRIHHDIRMYVVPGSRQIYLDALKKGLIEIFIESGCIILNPGCGPCMGAHQGLLAPGEVALSTSNRNFKGRMGSYEAEIYLASPATVAASALTGAITEPQEVV